MKIFRKYVSKVYDRIRIIKIGIVDVILCGGIYVKSICEIGFFKIFRFYRKSRKFWRIEFVVGNRVLRMFNGILLDYWNVLDEMLNKNLFLVERI